MDGRLDQAHPVGLTSEPTAGRRRPVGPLRPDRSVADVRATGWGSANRHARQHWLSNTVASRRQPDGTGRSELEVPTPTPITRCPIRQLRITEVLVPRGGCTRGGAAQARREPRRRRRPGRCRCADGVRGTTRLGDAARLRRSCSRHTRRGGRAVVVSSGHRFGACAWVIHDATAGPIDRAKSASETHACTDVPVTHHSAVGLGCDLVCDCVPSQRLRPHPARHDEPFHSDCTLQKDIRQRGLRCQLLSRDRHATMDFDSSLWKTSTDIDSGERTSDRIMT